MKAALRNVPVARFNRRFRRNGSESTTGRAGTRVAVRLWDCQTLKLDTHALNGVLALKTCRWHGSTGVAFTAVKANPPPDGSAGM